ncbi:unnamed protein product [Schistocephalus solidus]|uniref:Secreted protein n=1 Tax=Schistocephalus solidus TaxID=70667 RepID=A0A183TER8_SCHSO|nr:unnamed protein product [Schistocephalus solidus]
MVLGTWMQISEGATMSTAPAAAGTTTTAATEMPDPLRAMGYGYQRPYYNPLGDTTPSCVGNAGISVYVKTQVQPFMMLMGPMPPVGPMGPIGIPGPLMSAAWHDEQHD